MSGNKIALRKEQVELIEELAHANEQMGMQPAWAKILALLSVSDETELTFDQIMETLDLSKSGVSQALKQLELLKRVTYKTRIGDRKRYFHLKLSDSKTHMTELFSALGNLVEVNKKVLAKRSPKTKEFNKNLSEQLSFVTLVYEKVMESIGKK